jgi:hypothetical protein
MADARAGLAIAGQALEHRTMDGKDYWFDSTVVPPHKASTAAHLLPNFDEFTVAYRDRAEMLHADRPFEAKLFSFGSILSNVVTVGGKVRGSWRRSFARDGVRIEARMLDRLKPVESRAVEEAGRKFGEFLERPVQLSWR